MYYSKMDLWKELLSLPAIAAVGAYKGIFEPNVIGVTSLLLYIHRRQNNTYVI
jgi:hypothetical protein